MRQFDKGSLGTVGSLLWTNIESGETSEGITVTRVMAGCTVRNGQACRAPSYRRLLCHSLTGSHCSRSWPLTHP